MRLKLDTSTVYTIWGHLQLPAEKTLQTSAVAYIELYIFSVPHGVFILNITFDLYSE